MRYLGFLATTIAGFVAGLWVGRVTISSPAPENTAAIKTPLRTLDCSQLIIIGLEEERETTIFVPALVIFKIPDPENGVALDVACLEKQIGSHLNQNQKKYWPPEKYRPGTMRIEKLAVIPHGSLAPPLLPESNGFAFIEVRYSLDNG